MRAEVAVKRLHCHRAARGERLLHPTDLVLGDRENHPNRLQLRDDSQPRGFIATHDVARIDQPQADSAGDRRGDSAVGKLQLDVVDHAPIDLQCGFCLTHQCPLGIDLLARNLLLSGERLIACQVESGSLERRLIAGQLPLSLRQLYLVGTGVDFGKQVSLLDDLPLGECHAHQLSLHSAADRDGVERHDRSEAVEKQLHLLLPYALGRHRHDAGRRRLDGRRRGEKPGGQPRQHLGVLEVEAAESARYGEQKRVLATTIPADGLQGPAGRPGTGSATGVPFRGVIFGAILETSIQLRVGRSIGRSIGRSSDQTGARSAAGSFAASNCVRPAAT